MSDEEKGIPTSQASWALADWRRDPQNPSRLKGYQSHVVKTESRKEQTPVDRPVLVTFVDGSRLEWDGEKWTALSPGQSHDLSHHGSVGTHTGAEFALSVDARHAIVTYLTKWVVGLVVAIGALTAFVVAEIKSYAETVTKGSVAAALEESSEAIFKEENAAREAARRALEVSTEARADAGRARDTANIATQTGIELEKQLADARTQKNKAVSVVTELEKDLGDAKEAKNFIESLRGEYDKLAPKIAQDDGFKNAMASRLPNVPPGTIVAFAGTGVPPKGWELCSGRAIDSQQEDGKFKALIDAIGRTWGDGGDPKSWEGEESKGRPRKANLPDLRGMFLRGADGGDRPDSDPYKVAAKSITKVGQSQAQSIGPHHHRLEKVQSPGGGPARVTDVVATGEGNFGDATRVLWSWSLPMTEETEETRPQNATVNWIIKY